jgi:serine/threonine protein kinase
VDVTPLYDGRFVPFRRLGSGSQGETFEAVDRATGNVVALKRFDVHGASSWKDVELAEREASVLRSIEHPALPKYVAHFEQGGALYLAMEKVDGEDLAQSMGRGVRLSLAELTALVVTLADVFGYLHGRVPPLVHRDIKPSNLIRRPDGRFVLIDFGSVRDGLRPLGGSTVVGTFGYMAPEQFQGRALPATDWYGAGVTLLTLLTGTTPDKLPHRGLEIDVRASLPRSTPEAWLTLLERLTSADPDKRTCDLRGALSALHHVAAPTGGDENVGTSFRASANASSPKAARTSPPKSAEWAEVTTGLPSLASRTFRLPFPVLLLLHLLRVALFLILQVFLPLVLTLLSIPFGRSLRQAASDVARAGGHADRQLAHFLARVPSPSRTNFVPVPPNQRWDRGRAAEDTDHREYSSAKAQPPKRRVSATYADDQRAEEPREDESATRDRHGKV